MAIRRSYQRLDNPFQLGKRFAADKSEQVRLRFRPFGIGPQKDSRELKQLDVEIPVAFILGTAGEQTGDQCLSQDVLALPGRMFNTLRRSIGPRAKLTGQIVSDKRN